MKRRHFLAGAAGALVVGSTSGYLSLNARPDNAFGSLATVQAHLLTLVDTFSNSEKSSDAMSSQNGWTPSQHFVHMAESIELSISGYPVHYSDTFKATVGPLAFRLFSSKGASTHNTAELIPGTELVTPQPSLVDAIKRLINSIGLFEQTEQLKPHFAYGDLSKDDYRQAHLFHINEHWQDLIVS